MSILIWTFISIGIWGLATFYIWVQADKRGITITELMVDNDERRRIYKETGVAPAPLDKTKILLKADVDTSEDSVWDKVE